MTGLGDVPSAPRVLLVEAHADTRDLYAEYLRYAGFVVTTADTVAEATRLAASVDAVVSGLCIERRMDGIALIAGVRALDAPGPRLPVIIVTAHLLEADKRSALAAGADKVLTKPCSPDVIAAALRQATTPSSSSRRDVRAS